MSSSGTYSYWPKVNKPESVFVQMKSGEYQPPFYFGASQIPHDLGMRGSGIVRTLPNGMKITEPDYRDRGPAGPRVENPFIIGRSISHHTSLALSDHADKIYIPKHLSSVYK